VLAVAVGGCLTAQRKIMVYTLRPDGSGTGSIVFENLMSMDDDGVDASARDYGELINTYVKGNRFQELDPDLQNVQRRLYEENGMLCGELTFEFASYESVGLYRHDSSGPYMYHVGRQSDIAAERFDSSNGRVGGPRMPVVFWPAETTVFRIVAALQEPASDTRSLLPMFRRFGVDGGDQ